MSLLSSLTRGNTTVKQASLLLAATALLSNILGLVRNVVFYRLIPTSQLDIYYASFRIPDFLFNLLIFGAISSAFVPLFSGLVAQGKEEQARRFADQTFTWLTVIFGSLAVVLAIFMEPLMSLVVHGFEPGRFEQAVTYSRILMLQSVFFAWSYTCGGYLNSYKRFTTPALAPLVYNIAIIAGAFIAVREGLAAIIWAVVLGAICHFSLQLWEVRKTGYRPRWNLGKSAEMRSLARLMFPRSITQGMNQLVLIVYTALASSLTAGSIAIMSGMNDLQTTPTVIFVNSLAVALFPTLAATAATANWDELNRLIQKAFRLALFLLVPSLLIGFVLRAQIVRLYFSIGGASWELTNLAIATFVGFLIGIIPTAFVVLLSRVFYALKNTRTPMYLSLIAGVVGITWATVSIRYFHGTVASLALADAIVSITQCILFMVVLKRSAKVKLGLGTLLPRVGLYALGGAIASTAAWGTLYLIDALYTASGFIGTGTVRGLFFQLCGALFIGAVCVLAYSKIVLKEELAWIKSKRFISSP